METKLKEVLKTWLEINRPAVVLEKDYFIICRSTGIMIVTATKLRMSDIRLVQVIGSELVKGLTGDHWTALLTKIVTLRNVVFIKSIEDIFIQEDN